MCLWQKMFARIAKIRSHSWHAEQSHSVGDRQAIWWKSMYTQFVEPPGLLVNEAWSIHSFQKNGCCATWPIESEFSLAKRDQSPISSYAFDHLSHLMRLHQNPPCSRLGIGYWPGPDQNVNSCPSSHRSWSSITWTYKEAYPQVQAPLSSDHCLYRQTFAIALWIRPPWRVQRISKNPSLPLRLNSTPL